MTFFNFFTFISLILLTFSSCISKSGQNRIEIDVTTYQNYLKKGDEISNKAQGVLLANVGKAIQKGGTEFAVEFCNLQASSIIDSLNHANSVKISRVSIKNRNPKNNLKDKKEEQLWNVFSKGIKEGQRKDTVLLLDDKFIYYKPIKIAMSACLKCHGSPDFDIETATLSKIKNLYPNDLAIDYQLNDFRGLWKIEFSE